MDTYPYTRHAETPPFAFEIENAYVTPRRAARILRTIPGVTNVRLPKLFRRGNRRVEFDFQDRACVVSEDWGDSSRYWIGPKDIEIGDINISVIEEGFLTYRLPLLVHILGNLVSVKPFRRRSSLRLRPY